MSADSGDQSTEDILDRLDQLEEEKEELEAQVAEQQSLIQRMMPGRRDILKIGGASALTALGIGAAAGPGAATGHSGTVGTTSDLVNLEGHDINADAINATAVDTDQATINGSQVYVQGTAPSSPATGDIWIDNDG